MRIGMVLTGDFPPDIRVEKEALSLISAGHEVYILCLRFSRTEPACENYRGIEVVREYLSLKVHKKLFALILTVPFYRWFWRKRIRRFLCEKQIKVLHVHDLPLCGEGIRIAKAEKIPIVGDMHENYPELIRVQRFSNTLAGKLFISRKKWDKKEKAWLRQIRHVVCVEKEMQERMRAISPNSHFYIVPNTPDIEDLLQLQEPDASILKKKFGTFNLFYFGKTDNARGLDTLIGALTLLREKIPGIHAIIVGTGIYLDNYKTMAKTLELEQNISFEEWKPEQVLKNYMEKVDLCVLPHKKSIQTDNSSPNKLFLYMAFRKAVVASNCNSIARIIRENNCGLIFESGNAADMSEKILSLYANKALRETYALNAFNAVSRKYNWKITVRPLIELYAEIESEAP
ncbi:MAG: glycosyltransferase family 4 protein [Candidatus Neomarinimicrobiota bacterium]|jgi:glycosyltransferase involved in cell wall biosynthesis|nr:glycosyltransferase family 4 protein [Candidatus Neomarinimicrobiota bacterium]